jgi:L-amino acid N-acyltransferase YncA
MSLQVRPARSADAPELAELLNAIIARGGTTALQNPFTPARLDETYLTGPDVLSCVVAVDSDSGRLEGFQTLIREAHLPEGWGDIGTFSRVGGTQKGVGSALFAATLEKAAALGLAGINAQIRADNAGGLAFYGKMGFEDYQVDRAVPLQDGRPVDRINKRYALNDEMAKSRAGLASLKSRGGPAIAAHEHCKRHRAEIEASDLVGCFYCCETYPPPLIDEWTDEGSSAICPKCGIDSVIGTASGYPAGDRNFLKQMNAIWF